MLIGKGTSMIGSSSTIFNTQFINSVNELFDGMMDFQGKKYKTKQKISELV